MELTEIARELFECLAKRIYSPETEAEFGLTDRERAAIEAYLDHDEVPGVCVCGLEQGYCPEHYDPTRD